MLCRQWKATEWCDDVLDVAAVATAIILFTPIHCIIFAGVVLMSFLFTSEKCCRSCEIMIVVLIELVGYVLPVFIEHSSAEILYIYMLSN